MNCGLPTLKDGASSRLLAFILPYLLGDIHRISVHQLGLACNSADYPNSEIARELVLFGYIPMMYTDHQHSSGNRFYHSRTGYHSFLHLRFILALHIIVSG